MITTASPFFTAWPTFASILNTFPAAPAFTSMEPAPPAGAAFGAAAGAVFGAVAGLAAGAAPAPFSSTVTSYTLPFTVIV